MRWIGRLLGLIAALAGLAAAQGLGDHGRAMVLPTTATVSVTVPTLPAPLPTPTVTVPLPVPPPTVAPTPVPPTAPPPVPPTAPPPAVVSQLTSTATTPRAAPTNPPPMPSTPTGGATGALSSSPAGGSASTDAWSSGETTSRPAARKRSGGLEAKTQRSKNRISLRLEFTLPQAKRMFLIVRGPAPSCRIVGVIPFRGRKGENAARFAGHVRGRPLDPGVYLLTISPQRRPTPGAQTEYARVASPRRTVPLPEGAHRPTCTLAQTLAATPVARFLSNELHLAATPVPAGPAAPLRPPLAPTPQALGPDEDNGGVLDALPSPADIGSAARDSSGELFATLVIVLIVGLLLIGMLGLVTRFLRGTWNP